MKKTNQNLITLFIFLFFLVNQLTAQFMVTHTRGKLWETLENFGYIGHGGAWDYEEVTGIGFYPGFPGFYFPTFEEDANIPEKVTNANFHNFRSGFWVIAKDAMQLVPPAYDPQHQDFIIYGATLAQNFEKGVLYNNRFNSRNNFVESIDFNPSLPEEMHTITFPTVTGVTVRQRSMAWSFEDYNDFIIYDMVFKNTGDMTIESLNTTKHYDQTLQEVYITFQSGIAVSTKGTLNFHYNENDFLASAAPAGGFGGYRGKPGSDVWAVENDVADGKGLLYYSRDFNGGREPVTWDDYKIKNNWQTLLKLKPEWDPELQDPACFGFVFLYRTPPNGGNPDPFDADPDFFSIYSDEGHSFNGRDLDMNEQFNFFTFSKQFLFDFVTHSFRRVNDGKMYGWYTSTFGPYTLAPGDSVRLILAEIAGQLDMKEVVRGDPNHWFPDSSIAAMNRNVDAVRNAVSWGIGASAEGIDLAADVPESPPAPTCNSASTSAGSDTAIISIAWDKLAEEKQILDGAGNLFYDGAADVSGYRIYRSIFEMGVWDLVVDIPKDSFDVYWNESNQLYEYQDKNMQFGSEFYYYVQAYNSNPGQWISANGTTVNNLGELVSGDYNRTPLTTARTGPVSLESGWDVFVVPNPFVQGDPDRSFQGASTNKIEFRNLPEKAIIKIFSLSGDLIRTISHGPDSQGNLFGSLSWDQKSDSGLRVAPGLYIYVIQSQTVGFENMKTTGKLMIIR